MIAGCERELDGVVALAARRGEVTQAPGALDIERLEHGLELLLEGVSVGGAYAEELGRPLLADDVRCEGVVVVGEDRVEVRAPEAEG